MLKFLLAILAALLSQAPAYGQAPISPIAVFNGVCFGGRLDLTLTAQLAEIHARLSNFQFQEMSTETLRSMNPNSVSGWAIISGQTLVSVILSQKQDGSFVSRGCSVIVPGLSYESAKRLLQSSFRLRLLDEMQQTGSKVATYTVEVLSLGNRKFAMTIQSDPAGGFSILAFFELPPD